MEDLLSKYFSVSAPPEFSRFADIRYQLLTGTAGTVVTPAVTSTFYILVFRIPMYDSRKDMANQRDYEHFIEAASEKILMRDGEDFKADEILLNGKRLVCVYDHVDI